MDMRKQAPQEAFPEQKLDYLGLQAAVGVTKHDGGSKATNELIELCQIGEGKHVLDVGCGTGRTACLLPKKHHCTVVAIDISEKMLDWSKERAREEGVENKVVFRIADATNLPFEDNTFDAVICESVMAFVKDKQKAIDEYVRVTKTGGYIGFNESTWITPPPAELAESLASTIEEVEILTPDGWRQLMENAGLRDIVVRPYKLGFLGLVADRIRLIGLKRILRAWYLVITHPIYRSAIKKMQTPKNTFDYYGYGIYVGKKRSENKHFSYLGQIREEGVSARTSYPDDDSSASLWIP